MGRIAFPTRPPSSGAVIFYARARHNVRFFAGLPLKTKDKRGTGTDASISSDSENTSFETDSRSSVETKVEASSGDSSSGKASVVKGYTHAAVLALALAKDVVEVFSDVPYVQILAKVVQQVILISEEVTANKERCVELVEKISLYSKVVFDSLLELRKPCAELERLKEDLQQISSVLDGIQKLLATMVASNKSIIRRALGREDISQKLGEYDRKLDTSITLFQLKSSIVLRVAATQNVGVPMIVGPTANGPHRPKYTRQYSKPRIMVGRDRQITEILDVMKDIRAHVCIMGPGGIGKTSLALSIFHHDSVIKRYKDHRYFVSCEAATSPDLLLGEIAYALHIDPQNQHLLDVIRERLAEQYSLLVLDNFETSWNPLETRSEVEDILKSFRWCTGLIITMRGSQRPAPSDDYSQVVLLPLDLPAAEDLFCTISGKRDDYTSRLVKAVDGLPLAVSLLANLAAVEGETTQSLWERWQEEHTSMVENGHGRVNSLDASIKMSFTSPSMVSYPGALSFLGLLCMLPDGVSQEFLQLCIVDFPEPVLVRKALSILRRNALVQEDNEHYLKVLNPIRLYTQSYHPPSPKLRSFIHSYFIDLAFQMSALDNLDVAKFRREAGNVNAVLCDAVQHAQNNTLEDVVGAVFSFCQYSYISGVGSVQPLIVAEKRLATLETITLDNNPPLKVGQKNPIQWKKTLHVFSAFGSKSSASRRSAPVQPARVQTISLRADLLGCMGQLYSRQMEFDKATKALEKAKQLHIQINDRTGQAYDLLNIGLAMYQSRSATEAEKEAAFDQALKIHQELGDLSGQAHSLLAIGYAYCAKANLEAASARFTSARDIFVQLQDDTGTASALHALADIDLAASAFAEAEKQFGRAVSLYEKVGDQVSQSQALAGISVSWLLRSRFSKAFNFLTKAMKLREPYVDPDQLHLLGRIYIAQERWSKAREVLERSLELHESIGDTKGTLADHVYLARIELHAPAPRTQENSLLSIESERNPHRNALSVHGNFNPEVPHTWDAAMATCEIQLRYSLLYLAEGTAATILRSLKDASVLIVAHAYHLIGVAKLCAEKEDEALKHFEAALALHVRCDNVQGQADDINGICEALMRKGELHEASVRIQEALALHVKVGYVTGQGNDLYVQGCIFLAQGALEDAEDSIRKALALHKTSEYIFGQGRDLATLSDIIWQKKHGPLGLSPLAVGDASTTLVVADTTDTMDDADQVLEEAMELFVQCRARGEFRQCLKLKMERKGETWVERVFDRRWDDGDEEDAILDSQWPLSYDSDW